MEYDIDDRQPLWLTLVVELNVLLLHLLDLLAYFKMYDHV